MKKDEIKIERGVPIPEARGKGHSAVLRKMKKGESALFPTKIGSIHSLLRQCGFGAGDFTCRTVDGGVRVWRLK